MHRTTRMARLFYTLLLVLIAPFVPLYLLWRARRQPEYRAHWAERLGFYPPCLQNKKSSPLFWLHAVSVGETRATQPLVLALRKQWPESRILITHMTPTGRQTCRELFGDEVLSHYLPYDWPFAVRRFLHHFQPTIGILLETELWPNLIAACHTTSLPLFLVNARLSEKSANGYARFPALTREALQSFSTIAAQSLGDAQRLEKLGAVKPVITGNLKFDLAPPPELCARGRHWREQRKHRPALLIASSREGEESLILDAWARQPRRDILLILVPRHPQRFDTVANLVTSRNLRLARRSVCTEIPEETDVWLGDSMGEMFAYYASSEVAFIGGSLLDYGCQNLIEACAVGVPVLLGPSTYNFADAASAALECGAARQIKDASDLIEQAFTLLDNPSARAACASAGLGFAKTHRGATERTLNLLRLKLPSFSTNPATPS